MTSFRYEVFITDPYISKYLSWNPNQHAVDYLLQHPEIIQWKCFSRNKNPQAVEYMLQHPVKIDWSMFSRNENPRAVEYMLQHPDKINLSNFSWNKNLQAVEYMIQHPDKIDWYGFSSNSNQQAVEYLLQHPDKIDWYGFSSNSNPQAVEYLINHPNEIDWFEFSWNETQQAVEYLLQHPDKITWSSFPSNKNQQAVAYLINHPYRIDWESFSSNSNPLAVEYMLQHPENINWGEFSSNSNPLAVEYMLQHPEDIESSFAGNKNPLALEYMLGSLGIPNYQQHPEDSKYSILNSPARNPCLFISTQLGKDAESTQNAVSSDAMAPAVAPVNLAGKLCLIESILINLRFLMGENSGNATDDFAKMDSSEGMKYITEVTAARDFAINAEKYINAHGVSHKYPNSSALKCIEEIRVQYELVTMIARHTELAKNSASRMIFDESDDFLGRCEPLATLEEVKAALDQAADDDRKSSAAISYVHKNITTINFDCYCVDEASEKTIKALFSRAYANELMRML